MWDTFSLYWKTGESYTGGPSLEKNKGREQAGKKKTENRAESETAETIRRRMLESDALTRMKTIWEGDQGQQGSI